MTMEARIEKDGIRQRPLSDAVDADAEMVAEIADALDDTANWKSIHAAEQMTIERRRRSLRAFGNCGCRKAPAGADDVEDDAPVVGLALSGGGIRSATFSLGLLRALSAKRLIHKVDYLSTVSGGGYSGTFFCSLFVPRELRGTLSSSEWGAAQSCEVSFDSPGTQLARRLGCDPLGSPRGVRAIAQLRQGGHYLAPNGTSDALFAAVIGVRNWFAVAITTGLALLALFLFLNVAVTALGLALVDVRPAIERIGFRAVHPWKAVLVGLAFWPAACAWAYWFARSGNVPRSRFRRLVSVQALVALLIFLITLLWPTSRDGWHLGLKVAILALCVLAFLTYAAAEALSAWREGRDHADEAQSRVDCLTQEDRVRDLLSRWLLAGTLILILAAALAGIHRLAELDIGREGKALLRTISWIDVSVAAGVIASAIPIARWLLAREESRTTLRRGKAIERRRLRHAASLIVGTILLGAFVLFWATMAGGAARWVLNYRADAWQNLASSAPWAEAFVRSAIIGPLGIEQKSVGGANTLLALMALQVGLVAYLIGNIDSLLNRSSFSAFYSGRLRTAYLGATNRHRQRDATKTVDQDDVHDEITLAGYYHPQVLAPIHLINVTINETTSKTSRVIQRDRKGKSMTVAPSGYLYPPGAPGGDLALISRSTAEDLPLSSWMAISGAAFTTGAGHHTSLGTAMLASLTNLRMGYWWWRDIAHLKWRLRRPSRTVQAYLMRELRASYDGTHPERWYLSDGGHYENTGVYELVRRQVPFIIASDNGADRFYEFADLVNLIRKVRIDFGAEVEFLDREQLDAVLGAEGALRDSFGTIDEIRTSGKEETAAEARGADPKAGPYATLARISYSGPEPTAPSTLLLIKPRITGRELPDLIQYRDANAAFPQQPTTNQFFDEAQWESYYRLGQLIGDQVFAARTGADHQPWVPADLVPLPEPLPASPSGRASEPAPGAPC
ncbi:MAG: hypothetical protein QOC65_184 [Sphingomonadales bacterium]|nr:hypothetical protein [Sphingomonadales bacterium]